MALRSIKANILTAIGSLLTELFGGLVLNGPIISAAGLTAITYSASMTPDALEGNAVIVATNNTNFAINAPTNPPDATSSQELVLTIANASGGALGTATFNAIFHLAGAWTQPANGTQRSVAFRWNGAAWLELWRTAADVAN